MYTIPNTEVAPTEDLDQAKAIANELAEENTAEYEVINSENVIMHVATPVRDRKFSPWERVETPKFAAPTVEGFRPAYQRVRIQTVVYRAIDETGWLVVNYGTGERNLVSTTAQARAITNRMRAEA